MLANSVLPVEVVRFFIPLRNPFHDTFHRAIVIFQLLKADGTLTGGHLELT